MLNIILFKLLMITCFTFRLLILSLYLFKSYVETVSLSNSLLLDLSFIIFLVVDQIIFESQVSICEWLIPASIACFTDSRPNIKEKEIQAVLIFFDFQFSSYNSFHLRLQLISKTILRIYWQLISSSIFPWRRPTFLELHLESF